MKSIGNWLSKYEANHGENILFSCMANYSQNSMRAVGGKLFVTNQRVLFSPHFLDKLFGGEKLSLSFEDIKTIDSKEAGNDIFGGGLRKRLKITLASGGEKMFVVNKLDDVIKTINEINKNNS